MSLRFVSALLSSTFFLPFAAGVAQAANAAVAIDADDIGGTVTGPKGPEAGVWVIAETSDRDTPYAKIVVTDEQGRFVVPDLPAGNFEIWVRGYGLVDSAKVKAKPGAHVNLSAKAAASAAQAAEIYPASYWIQLLKAPAPSEFPGTGPKGNGIAPVYKTQQQFVSQFKSQCILCHQIGNKTTRTLPGDGNSVEGWDQRIQQARTEGDPTMGIHGPGVASAMSNNMTSLGRARGLAMFADWTDRIKAGALPPAPPRPVGVERNIVLTVRDWSGGGFVHDSISTDKRNPNVNAGGRVYGTNQYRGELVVLDPNKDKATVVPIPDRTNDHHDLAIQPHNPIVDQKGRVWMSITYDKGVWGTTATSEDPTLAFCTDEKNNKYAKYFPGKGNAAAAVYDPATEKMTRMGMCGRTHHLNFGYDMDNTLYFTGDANVMQWINTRVWDETKDVTKAVGWCPMVLDTNGDGKITPDRNQWNQHPDNQGRMSRSEGEGATLGSGAAKSAIDPKKDTRVSSFLYGMNASPMDGSTWWAKYSPSVGSGIVRFVPGYNAPETCMTEFYQPPQRPDGTFTAWGTRGVDLDSKGVAWVAFSSGQLARFDRSKCKVLNGPTALGAQCPQGWEVYDSPSPRMMGQTEGSGDYIYLGWVDLHNVMGLGKDVPIVPGANSDSLMAFMPETKQWATFRVPYPLGFYPRGLDARINNAAAGWKGNEIWASNNLMPLWHQEGEEGEPTSKMVSFQMRPDPLAH